MEGPKGGTKRGDQKGGTKKGGRPRPGVNTTQMDAKYHQFCTSFAAIPFSPALYFRFGQRDEMGGPTANQSHFPPQNPLAADLQRPAAAESGQYRWVCDAYELS